MYVSSPGHKFATVPPTPPSGTVIPFNPLRMVTLPASATAGGVKVGIPKWSSAQVEGFVRSTLSGQVASGWGGPARLFRLCRASAIPHVAPSTGRLLKFKLLKGIWYVMAHPREFIPLLN